MQHPINHQEEFALRAQRFAAMSDQELIDDYKLVHSSKGLVGSRLRYLSQLVDVMESRGLPIPNTFVSLKRTLYNGK